MSIKYKNEESQKIGDWLELDRWIPYTDDEITIFFLDGDHTKIYLSIFPEDSSSYYILTEHPFHKYHDYDFIFNYDLHHFSTPSNYLEEARKMIY